MFWSLLIFRAAEFYSDDQLFRSMFLNNETTDRILGSLEDAGYPVVRIRIPDRLSTGIILAVAAVLLARESRALIIGESADPQWMESIYQLVDSEEMVKSSKAPLSMHLGPEEILLALEVEFKNGQPGDIEHTIQRLEKKSEMLPRKLNGFSLKPVCRNNARADDRVWNKQAVA